MARGQQFFQRVAASLIVPITLLPVAALLLALGDQLHIEPIRVAGKALIQVWLPLFYAIGVSIGFTDSDAMGALSVVAGFFVMQSTAEAVAGAASLNVGVLGGIIVGALCTWSFNRVKHLELPEYLALFSGRRMGPILCSLVGIPLGYLFGHFWPGVQGLLTQFGLWIYSAGGIGVFVYGVALRLLIPTGLHHILMQLVDTQLGTWTDPLTGQVVAGEYLRFLAGDPAAGSLLSGFFLTLGFAPLGAALAIAHEARPEQRRRVTGLMMTGAYTAMLLGVTEPVEFAFIFASPVLFALHAIFSGLASLIAWGLGIRLGGYALPMILINWHRSENGWLLLPLGLAFVALYYYSFRAVIRWLRPPVLGQVTETAVKQVTSTPAAEGEEFLAALGGSDNITALTACMTRLRLTLRDPGAVDEPSLRALGASGILRPGQGALQVVVGARAGEIATKIATARGVLVTEPVVKYADVPQSSAAAPAPGRVIVFSPLTGRVVALDQVPDRLFADGLAGIGVAIEATDGIVKAPLEGEIIHVFPGGHAVGLVGAGGLEVLVHIGIDTVTLKGEGFAITATAGQIVRCGDLLGSFDVSLIRARGNSLISPVLITDPTVVKDWRLLQTGNVRAGEPLLEVELRVPA